MERSDEKGGRERKALPAALAAETLTLEEALSVLNAKDEVLGAAPGCEAEVLVKEGRFGPYYALGKLNASFGKTAEGFAPNMEHAMKRLEAKAAKLGARAVGLLHFVPNGACRWHVGREHVPTMPGRPACCPASAGSRCVQG